MRFIAILRKDLKRMVGDRRAFAVNLLLPLLLTAIMGASFGGGFFGKGGISAIPVALVAADLPPMLRDRLAEGLEESGFFDVTWADSLDADRMVRQGEAAAAVVLPPDAGLRFLDGADISVAVWKDPASPLKAGIVEQVLTRGLVRYQAGEAAYLALWPDDDWSAAGSTEEFSFQEFLSGDFADVWRRWRRADTDPVLAETRARITRVMDRQVALSDALSSQVVVVDAQDQAQAAGAGEADDLNLYNVFLPGFAVFFLMFSVAAGARDLHREKVRGTLQRQLMGPVKPVQILLGKWGSAALQGMFMLTVLFLLGATLFQVNLGPDPWSLLVIIILTNTATAGLFLLLALVTPNEKTMDNLSTVIILVFALLGGTFVPIDAMPAWMQGVGQVALNYWANLGFTNVVAKNIPLAEATLPVVVLGWTTLVLMAANIFIFRFRLRRGGLG